MIQPVGLYGLPNYLEVVPVYIHTFQPMFCLFLFMVYLIPLLLCLFVFFLKKNEERKLQIDVQCVGDGARKHRGQVIWESSLFNLHFIL